MIIDLHCHSKYSYDCYLEPLDLIKRARALGLDGICIAEHYSYTLSRAFAAIDQGDGFLILRGVEISTNMGHPRSLYHETTIYRRQRLPHA